MFYKKNITIQCKYNDFPREFIKLINDNFSSLPQKCDISVVFIFNQFPSLGDMEVIQKLSSQFKNKILIKAIFCKNFQHKQLSFQYKFFRNLEINCENSTELNSKSNFFLVINKNRIQFAASDFNFGNIVFMLQKYLFPHLKFEDVVINTDTLKHKILRRLKNGNLVLMNISTGNDTKLVNMNHISKVYFIHASCSPCQLKSIISHLNLKQIIEPEGKTIVIFSIFGEFNRLNPIISEIGFKIPVYLDNKDEFGLFSTISNDKENPIIIELNDQNS